MAEPHAAPAPGEDRHPRWETEIAYRRREERLRVSELSYRSLFDSLTDLVYLIDLDGNLLNVNAAVLRRYGYEAEELLGTSPVFLEAPDARATPSTGERFRRALAGEPQRFETWAITKSGERFPKEVILTRGEYFGAPVVIAVGRDISERKRAEEALRESEAKFRQIAENIREVFWMFDADFSETIYVSPAYEEIWGRSIAELYTDARDFLTNIHGDDLAPVHAAIEGARKGVPIRIEYRVLRDDGSERWVWARGFPVRDERGTIYRIVGTAEDITERKRAELERRAAEDHYRRLVETSPYGIYTVDAEGRFDEINQAAADLFERPASELIGRHFSEIVAPEEVRSIQRRRRLGSDGDGDTADYEVQIVVPSGERRLVHVRSARIGGAGELGGYHGILRDITEERAREEEMRLLATALESLDEGVSVARFDGQLIYANSTHARLLGYDPSRRDLPNSTDFIPNRAEAQRMDEMYRAVAEHGTWVGRVRRQRMDDGRIVPLELIAGRVDRHDGDSLVFNIARDVTEEIQKERELRRVERLASVGTMIGGVAHELNNPLHAIRNFAEILLFDERSEDDREALEIIRREADRAAKVVADLRIFARQTQEERAGRGAVDLNDILRHVVKLRRYALETRDVEVVKELEEELPPVWANRGEIEQVVLNLVVNAEQAMAEAPPPHRLVVRTRATEAGAVAEIADSGVGIPADQLERIFDPFWTTKPPGEGTGLGLSLAHRIVHEHGGEIEVESQVGRGATFRVELPCARDTDEEAVDPAETVIPPPTRSLRLLVVDDEAALRRAAERFLARRGHRVDTAADGAAALRLLDGREYDAIVSDLRMPGMDGETLVRRLRERRPGLERRIVFVTGDAASAATARDLGAGEIPVLIKPVRLDAVAEVVERIAGAGPTRTEGS